jgi:hypothetical protein
MASEGVQSYEELQSNLQEYQGQLQQVGEQRSCSCLQILVGERLNPPAWPMHNTDRGAAARRPRE